MTLIPKLPAYAGRTIEQFLRAHVAGASAEGVVIGLSGGIDSALTARLARDALGPSKVHGVILPDRGFSSDLCRETEAFAIGLGIDVLTIPIDPVEEAYRHSLPSEMDRVAWGNIKARIRMTIDYALARGFRSLVVGTGNKSELLLGYFSKYGDGGADLLPLGDLYKTQLRTLAREREIPEPILERAPTAGLWEGQTDEGELGAPYGTIDEVLAGLEQLYTEEEIVARTGLDANIVHALVTRVEVNRHKRRLPPIPKLGLRTVGIDWRD